MRMPTGQALALSPLPRQEAGSPQLQSGGTLKPRLSLTTHAEVGAAGVMVMIPNLDMAPVHATVVLIR